MMEGAQFARFLDKVLAPQRTPLARYPDNLLAGRKTGLWSWLDPAVEAELQHPRRRGRPPADLDAARWAAALRLHPVRFAGDRARVSAINREVLDARAGEIAAQRRGTLTIHRASRRDEGQLERRALIAVFVAQHPTKSASWLELRIKPRFQQDARLDVSSRTLRGDIAAIRKAGSATPE